MARSGGCATCEALPDAIPVAGTLYLAAPLKHTQSSISEVMTQAGLISGTAAPNVLSGTFDDDALPAVLQQLSERLTAIECDETRVLLLRDGERPELSSFLLADRLSNLIRRARSRWLIDVMAAGALVTHFQPIVSSQRRSDVLGYEALTRGVAADGSQIGPTTLYDAAVTENLLYHLDRSARIGAIRAADRFELTGKVFINFMPTSIYTPEFCLRSTIAAMRRTNLRPEQIVFEVVETERIHDFAHLEAILATYRREGFQVALDDLGAGYASLNLLHSLRPEYIKVDLTLVRNVDADHYKATIASKLLETAHDLGIQSIAEGVETEAESRWLTDHGAMYQQGYLFARPASPPPLANLPVA